MTQFIRAVIAGLLSFWPLTPLLADGVDFTQPQSPPKPQPKWLKIVDQGTNDPRLKGYFTPEGLKVEIVADFPAVRNPVGMTFADDGTPYVLEWVPDVGGTFPEHGEQFTYKDGSTRTVATMKKHVKDVVKVLTFNKDRGVYDQAKIILEDELPSSILLHDGWLYLSGRGTVRRYKQSKPGGDYDLKEVIAQGFCGFHHHQVSGMTIGNNGWLYITSGDDDNYVEGSDGSRATVLRTGAIFRCRPDGSRMQVYSIGYRNPYRDVVFDNALNMFHSDNDNEDGSKFTGCRLMHVAEASDFGWRLLIGARCCAADLVRGAVYGELPGKMPPLLKTGRGAPAGLLLYNDGRFPEKYRGLLYYPDVFRKLIRAYKVEPKGSTFEVVEEFEFMKSDDPLFRPCQMVLGPDGAMYIVDWRTNSGGAGQLWGDGRHGRIYRVSWAGTAQEPALPLRPMDSWARIPRLADAELLKALAGDEFSDRQKAQRELVRRGVKERTSLLRLVGDDTQPDQARIAALGALQSFWSDEVEDAFIKLLDDVSPDLQRLAADGLALNCQPGDKKAHDGLLAVLGDPSPAVRRAVALAMGRIAAPGAADSLVNALAFDDGKDLYLRDGLVRAVERLGKPGLERLLALADSGDQKATDKVTAAFLACRTRPAYALLPTLLESPHLRAGQRAAVLRSYTNYELDPPISLEPVLAYLARHKDADLEVKRAGLEAVAASGPLQGDRAQAYLLELLDEKDPGLRLFLIKTVEQTRVRKAAPALLRWLAGAGQPPAERVATIKALRVLEDKSAVPLLKEILGKGESTTAEALVLQREALASLAALDAAAAQDAARALVERKDSPLKKEAVEILGAQADGARLAGKLFLEGKLSRELLPQVSEAIRKHADRDAALATMLSEVMKSGLVVANDRAEVERVRRLVRTKGSPQRGRTLYLDSKKLACITCHSLEGVGGKVGPDLTRLWDTQAIEKIMESLIEPSKEIKEGYQAYEAITRKGQIYTGLKISQDANEVVLREASGKDVRIAAKDLEEVRASKRSLMPDNVVSQLSYEQFIDLVAFLKDRPAQESLRGLALDFWVMGLYDDDLKAALPAGLKADPEATYPGKKAGQTLRWQAAQAEPNGALNLRAALAGEHASAVAMTHLYSPRAQSVQMLLGHDGLARVLVNGEVVHEQTTPQVARPDAEQVEVNLKEGWNTVLVKVTRTGQGMGLFLRFRGEGLRVSRAPERK